jgi:hypothetical protein
LSTFVPGSAEGNVAASMATTIAPAPAAGVQRQIKYASVVNRDVSTQTVYLDKNSGAAYSLTGAIPLAPGDSLQYVDSRGFFVLTAQGFEKFIGATGAAGNAGATGPAGQGPPGWDGSDGEEGMPIPGAQGVQGIQGIPGTSGGGGSASSGFEILYQEISAEDALMIPGPVGPQGIQGIPGTGGSGMIILMDGEAGEDAPHIPGPVGPQGTAGSGGSGSANVTPDTHPSIPTGIGLGPNDEFEGAILDTAGTRYLGATPWTLVNPSTTILTLAEGSLVSSGFAVGNSSSIVQAAPAPPYTYVARLALGSTTATNGAATGANGGLVVTNSSGAQYTLFHANSGGPFSLFAWSSPTTFSANIFTGLDYAGVIVGEFVYVSVTNDGTNLIWGASLTGVPGSFNTLGSVTLASFIGSVSNIGIVNGSGSAGAIVIVDWFRRTA